jgi:signal transduction histidine kinase
MVDPTGVDEPATILLVDDHPANLVALEAALIPLGFPTVSATSGQQALRLVETHDFVIVLMDVHMPDLDGYETVRRLRQVKRAERVPVVFLTAAFGQPADAHRGYELGAVDYIVKPIDVIALRAKIRALAALYVRGQAVERERSHKLERMKNLVLGAVGHDLRTPLQTILMTTNVLARREGIDDAERTQLARIDRAARRMNRMIEHILDGTRLNLAGGITLNVERADLAEICRTVVGEVQAAYPDRALDLSVEGDARGTWDRARIERVVSNLLTNAVEHVKEGPVRASVVGAAEEVRLSVHNGGPAISSDLLPLLFDPFKRWGGREKGLGLGLYIVREIVRVHGGTVDVDRPTATERPSRSSSQGRPSPADPPKPLGRAGRSAAVLARGRKEGANGGRKHARLERLGKAGVPAAGRDLVTGERMGGDRNQARVARRRVRAQETSELVAVDAGHRDVRHHDGGPRAQSEVERFVRARHAQHLVASVA